jgi:hypothetical protein
MKLIKLNSYTYQVDFDTQREMCQTFLRFQENYESPQFKGKIFTLKEFKEWYKTTRNGRFTYYSDWSGFNIPSYVIYPFLKGKFDPLSKKEKALLEILPSNPLIDGTSFYLIGTFKGGQNDVLEHELVHALYYQDKCGYRAEINSLLKQYDLTKLFNHLKELGYHEDVWYDEANAYLVTEEMDEPDLSPKLKALYEKYKE